MQELIAQVRELLDAYQTRINEVKSEIAELWSKGRDTSANEAMLKALLHHRNQTVQAINRDAYEFITTQKVNVAAKLDQLRQMEKSTRSALSAASLKKVIEQLEEVQKSLVFIPIIIEDDSRINNAYVN